MKHQFDHERLDVYRVAILFCGYISELVVGLKGSHRHPRDQVLRASQSIPLNIAEGNGKRQSAERKRYFKIARGSAMESAAALDVLVATKAVTREAIEPGKGMLLRIVGMLVKLAPPRD